VVFDGGSGYVDHFRRWAEAAWGRVRGRLDCVGGAALHLWHGETANRGYVRRYRELTRLGYDPKVHLRDEPDQLWGWSEQGATLAGWANGYFRGRLEDGADNIAGQ
jgi:hypothetical protein